MSGKKSLAHYLLEAYEHYRAERAIPEGACSRRPSRLGRVLRWFVPNGGTLFLIVALILTQRVWARPLVSPNAPGPSANTVNYQGRLANPDGSPVADGNYGMSFSIYGSPEGTDIVWGPESHTAVPVSEGLFSVGLGSINPIPTSTWNGDRYLEITVGGETLSPRELIRSVPIAGMALTVPDGAIGADQIADGAITQEQAPFAPVLYHREWGGSVESVADPVIFSGWFHGSGGGYEIYDLSEIFTQIDAVMVTRTRTTGGTSQQVTFMVTDATGTGTPTPSSIRVAAYDRDGNLASWIQAYVVVIGR